MKKYKLLIIFLVTLIVLAIIAVIVSNVKAYQNDDFKINLLEEDSQVVVELLLLEKERSLSTFQADLNYDTEIFEELTTKDINIEIDEDKIDTIQYNKNYGRIVIMFTEDVYPTEKLLTFNLKYRSGISKDTIEKTTISFTGIESYSEETDDFRENIDIQVTIGNKQEEPETIKLSTQVYKIGTEDVNNYISEDQYIYRIDKETTLELFVSNLSTNGDIEVLKEDGTEVNDDELIATGMILRITKDEESIELKIAVTGDTNGDGKVSITDLTQVNRHLLETVKLENEYFLAADYNDNGDVTITDLSNINKILLEIDE